ncbi:subclass B1 metallo-beta-lactamase [Mucilaginibacter sp.]|uniref:subclass B1 metallo-beta-lactamase n=1 Tax=Mucilaginibacter sp. TaxID=1882438 RepID=UPI0032652D6F
MKKFAFFIFFVLISAVVFAQQEPLPKMTITPLTGNYYVATSYGYPGKDEPPFPANSLFVVTDTGIILIDTPWSEVQTQELIDRLQKDFHKKIVLCIATHFHDDRVIGFDVLRKNGAKTYTSKQTYALAKQHKSKLPEFIFDSDTTFTVGNVSLKTFFPGEGHSSDNIVVWFPQQLVLVGGCLVKSLDTNSKGYAGDANMKQWSTAIENVMQRYGHAKYVIPGHQGWAGGVEQLSHTMDVVK